MSADFPGPQSNLAGVGLHHFQRLSLLWADPSAQTGRSQGTKAESALEALPTLAATGPWKAQQAPRFGDWSPGRYKQTGSGAPGWLSWGSVTLALRAMGSSPTLGGEITEKKS